MTKNKEDTILFGKFVLDKILGKGAFAEVYLARNLKTGMKVAIKVISKNKLEDDRLKTEISIMRRLKHPNIVQLYQVMASKNNVYLVMEYVNGGTVFGRINSTTKKKLSKEEEDTWRRYFQQLITAVDFCHRMGIYHRDIKSDNLLLDGKGNLKLADFGLSTIQELAGKDNLFYSRCGAAAYLAPEILSGARYDGASADLWSCGIVLFEILTGERPFVIVDDMRAVLKKMRNRDFSLPARLPCSALILLHRLLDPDHLTRITIPEIMEDPWFKVGFNGDNLLLTHDVGQNNLDISAHEVAEVPNSPCINAFSLLASWPTGLDLAPLLEGSKGFLRFMSKQPVSAIISKFKEVANTNGFSFRNNDLIVSMERMELHFQAEISEIVPSLYAVDVSGTIADTPESENFLAQHMIPALQDIGWAWPGIHSEQKSVTPKNETTGNPVFPFLAGVFGAFVLVTARAWAKNHT